MSIIPELPPDSTKISADSVTAYLAFIERHDPVASSWTDQEVQDYSAFVARVAEQVQQAGPTGWAVRGADGEEHRFPTTVAAALWLQDHPVSA